MGEEIEVWWPLSKRVLQVTGFAEKQKSEGFDTIYVLGAELFLSPI